MRNQSRCVCLWFIFFWIFLRVRIQRKFFSLFSNNTTCWMARIFTGYLWLFERKPKIKVSSIYVVRKLQQIPRWYWSGKTNFLAFQRYRLENNFTLSCVEEQKCGMRAWCQLKDRTRNGVRTQTFRKRFSILWKIVAHQVLKHLDIDVIFLRGFQLASFVSRFLQIFFTLYASSVRSWKRNCFIDPSWLKTLKITGPAADRCLKKS